MFKAKFVISAIAAAVLTAGTGTAVYAYYNNSSATGIAVPDFVGSDKATVENWIGKYDTEDQVQLVYDYSEEVEVDIVMEQSLDEGTVLEADDTLQKRNSELESSLKAQVDRLAGASGGTSTSTYQVVTLSKGQSLKGTVGTEVMLRVGTAGCYATSSPGLIDTTDGSDLSGGKALVKNHLYMMTVEGRAVTATADTVKLLVRGNYTIG